MSMTDAFSSEPGGKYPDGKPFDQQPRWRQDFPIDTADDDAQARREFTKFLVLTSGAFVSGQCWIGLMSSLRSKEPLPEKRIATVAELLPRKIIEFRYPTDDHPCLLFRLPD